MSEELYSDYIIQQNKTPYHFEKREDAALTLRANNPVCGDRFDLFIGSEGDLSNLHFHGFGCALSKASTSVLLQMVEGKTHQEASSICYNFLNYLDNKQPTDIKEFVAFAGVHHHPARMDCVKLAWEKLKEYLEQNSLG